ncbi:MAG: hypothetical protein RJP95_02345, partial [Pirellulales bacterium]
LLEGTTWELIMSRWAQRLRTWATQGLCPQDVEFVAWRTGAVESWLRGQAFLAARDGSLGGGEVRAERESRIDLLVGKNAAEFKVVWNNKNFFGQIASVSSDWQKLVARQEGHGAVAVFFAFFERTAANKDTFGLRTHGVALQPTGGQSFGDFGPQLAGEFTSRVMHGRGRQATKVVPLPVDDGRRCWLGVWVQPTL